MPNFLDAVFKGLKPQPGKRYRLIRLDKENVPMKQVKGWEIVSSEDPAVKGTSLEKQFKDPSSHIVIGHSALAQTSEENAERLQKAIDDKHERRLKAIETAYLEAGEGVKRQLGKSHKAFKVFVKGGDKQ